MARWSKNLALGAMAVNGGVMLLATVFGMQLWIGSLLWIPLALGVIAATLSALARTGDAEQRSMCNMGFWMGVTAAGLAMTLSGVFVVSNFPERSTLNR